MKRLEWSLLSEDYSARILFASSQLTAAYTVVCLRTFVKTRTTLSSRQRPDPRPAIYLFSSGVPEL